MKEFKRTALIKKSVIESASLSQLFDYLNKVQGRPFKNEISLQISITGYIANGDCFLVKAGEKSNSCYFINEGSVICYYLDHKRQISVTTIFNPGQIAIVPESFMTDGVSRYFMVALNGTHFIEIPANDVKNSYKHYPSMERLARMIIVHQYDKPVEKDRLLRYKGKDRIPVFNLLFPQIALEGKKTVMQKSIIASFLGITPQSLSRFLKQNGEDKNGGLGHE